ncbi:hypothetical protein BJX63DRAFT_433195 [Aspergillus granulosus]|uniref:STEEP1 domain-containing protein n=1 Tax=Aspergillus granulosus TaxID=176169 RepID=A0ABR4H8A5_9EURO
MSSTDPQTQAQPETEVPHHTKLPITTHHCRFCMNLVLASTRDIESLPRRKNSGMEGARILPLRTNALFEDPPNPDAGTGAETKGAGAKTTKHYTILLSTTIRDRKPTIIRRADGFEKRFFFRCGRCRLVMGYFLDEVHFPAEGGLVWGNTTEGEGEGEDRAVYLLPGALTETEIMSDEDKLKAVDREWSSWFKS